MPNPAVLFCDSDALIQLFIADELQALWELKTKYGIQASIVIEVENELRTHRKYQRQVEPQLDKALKSKTVTTFDESALQAFLLGPSTSLVASAAASTWANIQASGSQYNLHVGIGEAYTYAVACALGVPALSNDSRALHVLMDAGFEVPRPVLRTFDVITFAYQIQLLTEAQCDRVRKELVARAEHVPQEFRNTSFGDGLERFSCRLLDNSVAAVGAEPRSRHQFATPLFISALDDTSA